MGQLEDNVQAILGEVQQISPLRDEIKELRADIKPLQKNAAISDEYRRQHTRTHATMTTIGVAVFVALLGALGFFLKDWIFDNNSQTLSVPTVSAKP